MKIRYVAAVVALNAGGAEYRKHERPADARSVEPAPTVEGPYSQDPGWRVDLFANSIASREAFGFDSHPTRVAALAKSPATQRARSEFGLILTDAELAQVLRRNETAVAMGPQIDALTKADPGFAGSWFDPDGTLVISSTGSPDLSHVRSGAAAIGTRVRLHRAERSAAELVEIQDEFLQRATSLGDLVDLDGLSMDRNARTSEVVVTLGTGKLGDKILESLEVAPIDGLRVTPGRGSVSKSAIDRAP